MKQQIRQTIQQAVVGLYPEHKDMEFSLDYAPAGVDADFASNVALMLAKKVGKKPMEVAEEIKKVIATPTLRRGKQSQNHEIASSQTPRNDGYVVTIAPPGFLNFKLPQEVWQKELAEILMKGHKYGSSDIYKGEKARVEYVSANPTGPIHIGNARGGPYGEVICNVLENTGYKVLREYLHNDIGGQVEKLGQTLWYWYKKLQGEEINFPAGGYEGEYLQEVTLAATKKLGKNLNEQDIPKLTQFVLANIFDENMEVLKKLGIVFDLIVKESDLRSSGKTQEAIEFVKAKGVTLEKDGALWFAPNDEFLEDREAVIVRSNEEPTYFASDIAYHKEKFESKYGLIIDIFGSNHHGHVPKLQALSKIFGFDPQNFKVLLYQYVRVKQGTEVVKMSKRAGTYVTAREVFDEVGKDSMIFTLLMTAINTHVDFDLELAKDVSEKNPVYKVQYAHARINSIKLKAQSSKRKTTTENLKLLSDPLELSLMREMGKFPEIIQEIAENYTVHHLPHYLLGLAEKFHTYYERVKVITEDPGLTAARLEMVQGVQIVLANGLRLMRIEPMEKM